MLLTLVLDIKKNQLRFFFILSIYYMRFQISVSKLIFGKSLLKTKDKMFFILTP